jgi:hypothetical protein
MILATTAILDSLGRPLLSSWYVPPPPQTKISKRLSSANVYRIIDAAISLQQKKSDFRIPPHNNNPPGLINPSPAQAVVNAIPQLHARMPVPQRNN